MSQNYRTQRMCIGDSYVKQLYNSYTVKPYILAALYFSVFYLRYHLNVNIKLYLCDYETLAAL